MDKQGAEGSPFDLQGETGRWAAGVTNPDFGEF